MSYTLDTSILLGSSRSGLILSATFLDTNGNVVTGQSGVTTNFKEIGNGCYLWHYNNYPDGFRGGVAITQSGLNPNGSNVLSFFAINNQEGENLDVKVSSRLAQLSGINSVSITAMDNFNHVLAGTAVEVYPNASGYILQKTYTNSSDGSATFSLDPGTYRFYLYNFQQAYWVNPTYITVSGSYNYNIQGIKLERTDPMQIGTARLYLYATDIGLNPQAGIELTVQPSGFPISTSGFILSTKNNYSISDSTGYAYVDVPTSFPVTVKIPKAKFTSSFITPSSGSLNLATLIT